MNCSSRTWALLVSLLQTCSCAAAAGGFLCLLNLANTKGVLSQVEGSNSLIAALISSGLSYIFCALLSLVGFLGIYKKNIKLLKIEIYPIFITIMLQIATGLFITVIFNAINYNNRTKEDCIHGSSDTEIINTCNAIDKLKHAPKSAITWTAILPIVIMIYACIVKLDYYHHLAQTMASEEYYENVDKHFSKDSDSVRSSVISPSLEKYSPSAQLGYV